MTIENKLPDGITLKTVVSELHQFYGWQGLSNQINLDCFTNKPSIKSSLTFLRKTDWARAKVEQLYLQMKAQQS